MELSCNQEMSVIYAIATLVVVIFIEIVVILGFKIVEHKHKTRDNTNSRKQ